MEDDDEMADYGTDLSDDVESIVDPHCTLMPRHVVDTRHLGNRIPDSPVFPFLSGKRGISRFSIGRE